MGDGRWEMGSFRREAHRTVPEADALLRIGGGTPPELAGEGAGATSAKPAGGWRQRSEVGGRSQSAATGVREFFRPLVKYFRRRHNFLR